MINFIFNRQKLRYIYLSLLACPTFLYAQGNEILIDNFETLPVGTPWPKVTNTEVMANCAASSEAGGNQCLRVKYIPNSHGSPRLTRNIELPAHDHYILSYDVFFENGFEFVQGGKLHGLGSYSPVTGCEQSTRDGWSSRVAWKDNGAVKNYYYDQDKSKACGEGTRSNSSFFQVGQWQHVDLEVKLNNSASNANGFITISVDGNVIIHDQNLHLRASISEKSLIQNFMFSTFFGGDTSEWAPSKVVYARFDNFKVIPKGSFSAQVKAAINKTKYSENKILSPRLYIKQTPYNKSNFIKIIGFENMLPGNHLNSDFQHEFTNTSWFFGADTGRVAIDSNNALTTPGQSLSVALTNSSKLVDGGINWQLALEPRRKLVLSYWVYFDEQFDFSSGGVLPGLRGVGSGSNGDWCISLAWQRTGELGLDVNNSNNIESYKLGSSNINSSFTPGSWHFVQMRLSLGESAGSDRAEVWLDHVKIADLSSLSFSPTKSADISALLMSSYPKSVLPSSEMKLWFDDILLSKDPI